MYLGFWVFYLIPPAASEQKRKPLYLFDESAWEWQNSKDQNFLLGFLHHSSQVDRKPMVENNGREPQNLKNIV